MGRHTLRSRLVMVLMGLAGIPVLLLGLIQAWLSYDDHMGDARQALAAKVEALGMQVSVYFGGFERELRTVVRLEGAELADRQQAAAVLRRLLADRRTYREAAVMDAAGMEWLRMSTTRLIQAGTEVDRSADPVFAETVKSRGSWFGGVHFAAEDGEPLIDVATPVFDPADGRLRAVLRAELRIRPLWDLVAANAVSAGEELYLVDDKGRVIANRNPSRVLAQTQAPEGIGGQAAHLGIDGRLAVSASHAVTIGGRTLVAVAEREMADISRNSRQALVLSAVVIVLAMMAAAALMAAAVRTILKPIRDVAEAARAVHDGELGRQVPVRTHDEVGELAETFNSMTARLRGVLDELRREIAVRTENELRFRGVFEQAAVGMALVGLDGSFLAVNGRLCATLGYSAHELLQVTFRAITAPEDAAVSDAEFTRLRTGETETFTLEKRYLRKDGSQVWVNLTAALVRDDAGTPMMLVSVVEDISARKEAEARLHASVEELSRSNLELERFAYVASHDLQEPLRNVISFSQLLQRKVGGDPETAELFGYIIAGAHRMRDLVRGLLEYSRAGSRGEAFVPVDLGQVIQEAKVNLEGAIAEAGASVLAGALPVVVADRMQMVQLMQNLIANAIKFRHRERPPMVMITAEEHADGMAFSVADNGIGVAPEYREQVFVIFKRLHQSDVYPGVGIGLAICRRIVERHGGRIWIEQPAAGGTIIRFTLPNRAAAG
ncbi:MAG: PAS domain S-box protein [Actinomycetota bacterium]